MSTMEPIEEKLVEQAELFPFEQWITSYRLSNAKQFRDHRQGLDLDTVELAAGGRT